jgi:hypothetical protein
MSLPNLAETNQNLAQPAPKILIDLINAANGTEFTLGDMSFGAPIAGTVEDLNTDVTATANGTTTWSGSALLHYNRLDLNVLFGATGLTVQLQPGWTTTIDILPAINAAYGLMLTSDDIASAALATGGDQVITAKATSLIYFGTYTLQLKAVPLALAITGNAPDVTDAHPNHTTTFQYTVVGGTPPYTVNFTGLGGPANWTIDNTGLLTIQNAPGQFSYGVIVTDHVGATAQLADTVQITMVSGPALALAGSAPDFLLVGPTGTSTYGYTASGGAAPYTYAFDGAAPAGWTINGATGVVTIPHTAGTFNYGIKVTDNDGTVASITDSVVLSIAPALTLTGTAPDLSQVAPTGSATYQYTLAGGKAPYTVAFKAGTTPAGWTVTNAGLVTMPKTAGTFNYTLQLTDANGTVVELAETVVITTAPAVTLTGAAPDLTLAKPGASSTYKYTGGGGKAPLVYAFNGAAPSGWTINGSDGTVTMPNVAGTYNYTVQVTDANGTVKTLADSVTITVAAAIVVTGDAPDNAAATNGDTYTYNGYAVTGGKAPLTWALGPQSEDVPAGWALNASTGVLSGPITTSVTMSLHLIVTDANGSTGTLDDIIAITVAA